MISVNASSLARFMVCPGSKAFDLPKPEQNEAAKEGVAAAEYLEKYLKGETIGTHSSEGYFFDDDIKYYCKLMGDRIKARAGNNEIQVETTVNFTTNCGVQIKGRYDFSWVDGDTLYIGDLKYGFGIVEPDENWQLIAYAIGEVLRRGKTFDNIVLMIVQPRPWHDMGDFRAWPMSYSSLIEYHTKIERQCEAYLNGDQHLTTGEQCKYCPAAAAACPAMNKAFWNAIDVTTQFLQDDIPNKELGRQLDIIERVKDLIKIKETSLQELAVSRIKEGSVIPGYATTDSWGHRKWKPDVSPDAIKLMTGIDVVKQDLLSPAQVERLGVPKDLVKQLCTTPFLGQKLKRVDANKLADNIFGKGE